MTLTNQEYPKMAPISDFSDLATWKRLSSSALKGFAAIAEKWHLSPEQVAQLLGGEIPAAQIDTLNEEQLTRISYIIGIYRALHVLLSAPTADDWIMRPNTNLVYGGQTPLNHILKTGLLGLEQTRRYLDAACQGY